jgi:hypothetical protein
MRYKPRKASMFLNYETMYHESRHKVKVKEVLEGKMMSSVSSILILEVCGRSVDEGTPQDGGPRASRTGGISIRVAAHALAEEVYTQ